MTTLKNEIVVGASPAQVWDMLARLDALADYDPAVAQSTVESASATGTGATRRCELKAGGWFRERVDIWEPERALAFVLYDCTLPVHRLRHEYTLTLEGSGTRVSQRMEYELKFGFVGAVLDAAFVRRKWNAGVRTFLIGLKTRVEADAKSPPAGALLRAGILGAECR